MKNIPLTQQQITDIVMSLRESKRRITDLPYIDEIVASYRANELQRINELYVLFSDMELT